VLRRDTAVDVDVRPHTEDLPEQECAANEAAASFGVTEEDLEHFILRVQPLFSERKVVAFARRHGVHPGIVVGRLQYRLERYNWLRKHLVSVREFVASAALTDGYGQFCPT
jgi:HTH-type transcriptional regulator / antitoxin HigA